MKPSHGTVFIAAHSHSICFGIILITQKLEPLFVIIPCFNVQHAVWKKTYKNQAYTGPLKSTSPLNTNALLWRHFLRAIIAVHIKIWRPYDLFLFFCVNAFHTPEVCRTGLRSRGFEWVPQGGATLACNSGVHRSVAGVDLLDPNDSQLRCKGASVSLSR